MNSSKKSQSSVESKKQDGELQNQSVRDSMQQWLSAAQASSDARTRIAVTNGISKGVFGFLHLSMSDELGQDAANDNDYTEDARCA